MVEILGSREPGCGSCRWFVRLVVPGGATLVVASDPTRLLAASQQDLRGSDAALAFLAGAVEHANLLLRQLDAVIEPEVLGRLDHQERNLIEGQGETTVCGCGWPITDYEGRWLHLYNPELTGCDDHEARP